MARMNTEHRVARDFPRDTAEHRMRVVLDHGLYRHLRFRDLRTGFNWFDLITVPGALIYQGDMGGGYVFHRLEDMFAFFRGSASQGQPNLHYWSGKVVSATGPGGVDTLRVYDSELMAAAINAEVEEFVEWNTPGGDKHRKPDPEKEDEDDREEEAELVAALAPGERAQDFRPYLVTRSPRRTRSGANPDEVDPDWPDRLRTQVYDEILSRLVDDRSLDFGTVSGFQFYITPPGIGEHREPDLEFHDPWEWDISDWDYRFAWACHAIVRGIADYDAYRALSPLGRWRARRTQARADRTAQRQRAAGPAGDA